MVAMFKRRLQEEAESRHEAEIVQELALTRQQVASARPKKIQELAAIEVGLRADEATAQAALERGDVEREAARLLQRKAVNDAQRALSLAVYPRQRAIDEMETRLRGELCPESITDALATIDEIREAHRISDDYDRAKKVMTWCATAQQALTDLQVAECDDIDREAGRIMAAKPE